MNITFKMFYFRKTNALLLSVMALIAVLITIRSLGLFDVFLENRNYRDVLHLYLTSDISLPEREDLLKDVWRRSCELHNWDECHLSEIPSWSQMINLVDANLLHPSSPLILVTPGESQELSWDFFRIRGVSVANQNSTASASDSVSELTLWGSGYVEARLFLFSPMRGHVSIDANHDAPPPVVLDVELARGNSATLTYDKGDQSWESKSTSAFVIPGGYNILRVWYLNDYFDSALGLDRNAHMRSISILND